MSAARLRWLPDDAIAHQTDPFHFGLQDRVGESTLGALFIAVPAALASLGRVGDVVTAAFFVMLFFAALTSAISVLEVVVAAFVVRLGGVLLGVW